MKDPVYEGDMIEAIYDHETPPSEILPECNIHIYYQDEWLIVCEKPADLVTHPSWQHMDDSLIQRLSSNRLHPVMRLDRETSGLIIVAKNGYAHHLISSLPMEKEYLGIVYGNIEPARGTIDLPIGRADNSIMIRVVRDDGKSAVTHYETMKTVDHLGVSLVRFVLSTGRCHQIRVHCRHLGHPIVCDGLYGPLSRDYTDPVFPNIENESRIGRQALHANRLSFFHPITGEKMEFESPLPDDMKEFISEK
jgi:23S rRNA pseudouridine1911/1915/1917 synthase